MKQLSTVPRSQIYTTAILIYIYLFLSLVWLIVRNHNIRVTDCSAYVCLNRIVINWLYLFDSGVLPTWVTLINTVTFYFECIQFPWYQIPKCQVKFKWKEKKVAGFESKCGGQHRDAGTSNWRVRNGMKHSSWIILLAIVQHC